MCTEPHTGFREPHGVSSTPWQDLGEVDKFRLSYAKDVEFRFPTPTQLICALLGHPSKPHHINVMKGYTCDQPLPFGGYCQCQGHE